MKRVTLVAVNDGKTFPNVSCAVIYLQAQIETLKSSERQLQTHLATEQALRTQADQQLETVRLNSQKALADVEITKSQLEKD